MIFFKLNSGFQGFKAFNNTLYGLNKVATLSS